jgi:hypothetical protein
MTRRCDRSTSASLLWISFSPGWQIRRRRLNALGATLPPWQKSDGRTVQQPNPNKISLKNYKKALDEPWRFSLNSLFF